MNDPLSLRKAHTELDPSRADRLRRCRPRSDVVPESTDYLYPGQLFTSSEPAAVMTILGSCVAICLWAPGSGAGGMNHFLLPHGSGAGASGLRYGSLAVPELIRRILAIGGKRDHLRAKVFGGACLTGNGVGRLSAENVAVARSCLAEAEIPIVAEDVGGVRGRKLIFRIPDGDVWVKAV